MNNEPQKQVQLQIKATDEDLKGRYANAMRVGHTKEEFILDFFLLDAAAGQGQVTGRIVVSPGHAKRIVAVLAENIKIYEGAFGEVEAAKEPSSSFGFTDR